MYDQSGVLNVFLIKYDRDTGFAGNTSMTFPTAVTFETKMRSNIFCGHLHVIVCAFHLVDTCLADCSYGAARNTLPALAL